MSTKSQPGKEDPESAVKRLSQMVETLRAERDEADRRAGAAERQGASLQDDSMRRTSWLSKAKDQAGYHSNVSFDVVWAEVLEKSKKWDALQRDLDQKTQPQAAQDEQPTISWSMLARFGRVDALPFRVPGTMRSEDVECVVLTRQDVDRLGEFLSRSSGPNPSELAPGTTGIANDTALDSNKTRPRP